MYYNIKIKVLDSEYSLESQNRGIVEREMDAYFAYFFDVSYEFKSQIKQVELTKDSLVSIDKIENPDSSYNEEEIRYYESSDDFDDEPVSDDEPSSNQELISNDEPVSDDEPMSDDEPVSDDEPSSNQELISNDEHSCVEQIIEQEQAKEETLEEIIEEFNQETVEDKQEEFVPDIIIDEPEVQQAPVFEENSYQEPIGEIFKEEEPTPAPTEPQMPKLDFKLFLSGFIISDIFNQFIACAFYMKNVLKENCFNMKAINSHLIKATGNIADMSVVFELIQKEYIESKEINDSTVYFITPLGEEYFIKKYQE